jgi:predicted anti-sigma-YlaC factor YlaD
MNCEKCQDLVSELIDGSLNRHDYALLEAHLGECLECAEVRNDLSAIVGFCREHRGEYDAPANQRALWLRISNTIESEIKVPSETTAVRAGNRLGFLKRSWELSFPQLAAAIAAIVIVVSLGTVVGVRRLQNFGSQPVPTLASNSLSVKDRYRQQQQVVDYWNQRVELNKARWNPQMRETFDRNMSVIDAALADSLRELNVNPHDEVSEEMLNAALNDKVELLKEFAQL